MKLHKWFRKQLKDGYFRFWGTCVGSDYAIEYILNEHDRRIIVRMAEWNHYEKNEPRFEALCNAFGTYVKMWKEVKDADSVTVQITEN